LAEICDGGDRRVRAMRDREGVIHIKIRKRGELSGQLRSFFASPGKKSQVLQKEYRSARCGRTRRFIFHKAEVINERHFFAAKKLGKLLPRPPFRLNFLSTPSPAPVAHDHDAVCFF